MDTNKLCSLHSCTSYINGYVYIIVRDFLRVSYVPNNWIVP